jgi:hypothetical protein
MTENQAVGSSKKSHRELWKERLHSFSRGHSHASSRAKSPVPGKVIADDASSTVPTSAFILENRPAINHDSQIVADTNAKIPATKLDNMSDDRKVSELDAATERFQDQENESTDLDTTDSTQEDGMWKIAEAQLRKDAKKN